MMGNKSSLMYGGSTAELKAAWKSAVDAVEVNMSARPSAAALTPLPLSNSSTVSKWRAAAAGPQGGDERGELRKKIAVMQTTNPQAAAEATALLDQHEEREKSWE